MGELELGSLAERINAEHRACEEAATTALSHAMNAGDLLTGAKDQLPHGGFGAWLEENFAGSGRTARAYMRVARHRAELEACVRNRQSTATLSLDGALKALAPHGDPHGDPPGDSTGSARRGSPATLEDLEAELGGALSEARAASLGVAEGLHEIYRGRGWASLGYDSFAEYVAGEFAAIPYAVVADDGGEPLPLFAMAESLNAWGVARVVDPLLREGV